MTKGEEYSNIFEEGYQQGRAEAIDDVIRWFRSEFKRQNDPKSKFVPSCVIKENIYDILEKLKEEVENG